MQSKPRRRFAILALVLPALTVPLGVRAQEPAPGGAAESVAEQMARLAFMSGCWVGTFDYRGEPGTLEERYSTPAVTAMLGVTRYLGGGRVVKFEFTSILVEHGQVVMTPYPHGQRSEHGFRATSVTETEAIFEAPEHDFPKRIIYRRDGDRLVARIDGGADSDQSSTWTMTRASCEM